MKRTTVAAALLAPLLLFACATPTPYQPLAPNSSVFGGYSDQVLDDTHFRVGFNGNDSTSRDQVETYLLYRAAELTTSHGFDWFEMVDRNTQNTGTTYVEPYFYGPGYWRPSWRFYRHGGWGAWGGWYDPWGPEVEHFDRFSATADIVVGHGPRPAADPRAFDAHQVMANLEPKIMRPGQTPPAH